MSNHIHHVGLDFSSPVAPVPSILDGLPQPRGQGIRRGCQFEGEDKVQYGLEALAHGTNLLDNILQADDLSTDMLLH